MKTILRTLFLLFALLCAFASSAQSYLILWNSGTSKFQVKQVNPTNGSLTPLGYTSVMASEYDLDEIFYDATNNQLVGLYQDVDLWKYDLTTNTDQIVDLGSTSYSNLILTGTTSYLVGWNNGTSKFDVKELNLSTAVVTPLGSSTTLSSSTDLNKVFYDPDGNQLVGIYWGTDLWRFNLTNNTDDILDISGSDYYRALSLGNQKAFLIGWNSSTSKYDINQLNLSTGAVTAVGSSTVVNSLYNINQFYYDFHNNQLVALHAYNALWRYNLLSNTDQLTSLGSDLYRDLEVVSEQITTGVLSPLNEENDEIVKVYDMMGRELSTVEPGKVLILQYKSGKVKKVWVRE